MRLWSWGRRARSRRAGGPETRPRPTSGCLADRRVSARVKRVESGRSGSLKRRCENRGYHGLL
jgi:hypothetical protein